MEEEWRSVVGWEDLYEVSDKGRVRSIERIAQRSDGKPYPVRSRILSQRLGWNLYHLSVELVRDTKSKHPHVHRLVAMAFLPNPKGLPLVLHGPRGPLENDIDNLRWGTQLENMQDRIRDGNNTNLNKTHCPKKHEYNEVNTGVRDDGKRYCRECARIRRAKRIKRGLPKDDPRHGTSNGSMNYGCKCDRCREARRNARY